MNNVSINTYSDRRRVREALQREEVEGESLDPAMKCKCSECGQVHFKPKEKQNDGTSGAGNHQASG